MLAPIVCGIAGTAGRAHQDDDLLESMALAMAKRGPDGQGIWKDDGLGFAIRRLAIIDLHERSNQPMHFDRSTSSTTGRSTTTVSCGKSSGPRAPISDRGDTEVLLHAWAEWEGALDRLNGMFAFAVWDTASATSGSRRIGSGKSHFTGPRDHARLRLGTPGAPPRPRRPSGPDEETMAAFVARGHPDVTGSFFAGV